MVPSATPAFFAMSGVVGVPIRVLAPPEIALFELRRTAGRAD